MSTVLLEGMRFYACHGCFKEENIIGNAFEVDLKVELDSSLVEKSDNVEAIAQLSGNIVQNLLAFHFNELVFERRAAAVDNHDDHCL